MNTFSRLLKRSSVHYPWLSTLLLLPIAGLIVGCQQNENESDMQNDNGGEMTEVSVRLLDPTTQPKFVNDLPVPTRIQTTADETYDLPIKQGQVWKGLLDEQGQPMMTTVWGFEWEGQIHSPGPSLLTESEETIHVHWDNQLPEGPHLFPVDRSLHIAETEQAGGRPIVIHLHGGHSEAESDGNPLAWYTQQYAEKGPAFAKEVYEYDNTQDAATLWYHDHTLGMTRLNVYAGIAGFYLLSDDNERRLINNDFLPSFDDTYEMIVTDSIFTSEGELYYPGMHHMPPSPVQLRDAPNDWPDPTIFDEFWGDFILVNGMAWPKFEAEPQVYRFRVLNGSDTRSYVFRFDNDMTFYQVGTDGGFLDNPVAMTELVLAPAERADILVDFTHHAGESITLQNFGPDVPFKGFVDANDPENSVALMYNETEDLVLSDGRGGVTTMTDPETTGQIMRFNVASGDPMQDTETTTDTEIGNLALTLDTPLRTEPLERLGMDDVDNVRQLGLFRVDDPLGRSLLLLGTLEGGSMFFDDPVTEVVEHNAVEIWEIYNTTVSGHPIHLHLVEFEVLSRQPFVGENELKVQEIGHTGQRVTGEKLNLEGVAGEVILPQPNEQGPKDTVVVLPGQVTRVIARFDRVGEYVWHCHLISHEDFDMMRPMTIVEQLTGSPPVESASLFTE